MGKSEQNAPDFAQEQLVGQLVKYRRTIGLRLNN